MRSVAHDGARLKLLNMAGDQCYENWPILDAKPTKVGKSAGKPAGGPPTMTEVITRVAADLVEPLRLPLIDDEHEGTRD